MWRCTLASILKGQSGQPIQFETTPNVNGDDVAVMANVGPVTNFDSATGTVIIPSGLEIGTRRLIRKIHPTQGTVTINCTGETFTRAGLTSVTLNADGDYWLIEKAAATRWELLDGRNTGENANGYYYQAANGVMEFNANSLRAMNDADGASGSDGTVFFSGVPVPVPFIDDGTSNNGTLRIHAWTDSNVFGPGRTIDIAQCSGYTRSNYELRIRRTNNTATRIHVWGTGRWYN